MTAETRTAEALQTIRQRYPRRLALKDGRQIELRLMGEVDRDRVLAFARSLPHDDLLFLRNNITEPAVVDAWLQNIAANRTITVLAYEGDRLLGDGSLHHSATTWTRHLGEIRLLLAPGARGGGLGRILAEEIYAIAKAVGLRMLTAQMTLDQAAAQAIFRSLGFQREAVLLDYAIDAEGQTRNLLVATRRL